MLRSMVIRVLTVTALGLLCLDTLNPVLCFSDARQQGTALCRLLLHIQRRVAGESDAESESSPRQTLTRHKPEYSLQTCRHGYESRLLEHALREDA